ncbi:MAG: superoxide dismutase family protein [Sphingomonadaceae bacterium]
MNGTGKLAAALSVLGLAACGSMGSDDEPVPVAAPGYISAIAELRDAQGNYKGAARFTQLSNNSIRVRIDAENLPAGAHGAHLHDIGVCAPPDFSSAGSHWNPTDADHGFDNPAGKHKGDLPNLLIGADGRGMLEYTIDRASLGGEPYRLLDENGAAVVVHARADDMRTDPAGDSGPPIACGVIRPA